MAGCVPASGRNPLFCVPWPMPGWARSPGLPKLSLPTAAVTRGLTWSKLQSALSCLLPT